MLQGAAGGALIPISQAIMMETFPPNQQGMAMAIFGVGAMFGPIVGPALGGWITDNLNWRWIFYINLPFGIAALVITTASLHIPKVVKKHKIDYLGAFLLVTGVAALLLFVSPIGSMIQLYPP